MQSIIMLHDYEREWLPFDFPGFWQTGHCFLRISIKKRKALFFCSQLPDYYGTSVTNAVEEIRIQAIRHLRESTSDDGSPALEVVNRFSIFEKIFKSREDAESETSHEFIKYLNSNSIWIEHYPPGIGLVDAGSYAIVNFSDHNQPAWNYVSKDRLKAQIPGINLDVSLEKLRQWNKS